MAQSPDSATRNMEGRVMLALSTFRKSEKAICIAIEKSRDIKKLAVVYVADVNLARNFVDVDLGLIDIVEQVKPSLIVTTRSKRPEWVKKFFGAPVEDLTEKAGCPVTVV